MWFENIELPHDATGHVVTSCAYDSVTRALGGGDYLSYAPVNMVRDLSPLRHPCQ